MRFEVIFLCENCQQNARHVIRSNLNAKVFIQLTVTCQKCGYHNTDWYSKKAFQELFIAKIRSK